MNKHFTKKRSIICSNIMAASLLLGFTVPQFAFAEIYKHVGPDGRITYSNVKIKGGKKLDLEPADTSFGTQSNNVEGNDVSPAKKPAATRATTPASFPKVDANTQNQRDGKRKDILQSELEAEKKALDEAKKAYVEGESNPEVFKTKDGKTLRNVPKFEAKIKSLQAEVDVHERNIELLEKEISNIN